MVNIRCQFLSIHDLHTRFPRWATISFSKHILEQIAHSFFLPNFMILLLFCAGGKNTARGDDSG